MVFTTAMNLLAGEKCHQGSSAGQAGQGLHARSAGIYPLFFYCKGQDCFLEDNLRHGLTGLVDSGWKVDLIERHKGTEEGAP